MNNFMKEFYRKLKSKMSAAGLNLQKDEKTTLLIFSPIMVA